MNLEIKKNRFNIDQLEENELIKFIFFGNYFYGICVIGLSIEASLQQKMPLNHFLYYIFVFLCCVFYYNKAYITENTLTHPNKRSEWYAVHTSLIKATQLIIGCFAAFYIIFFSVKYSKNILSLSIIEWILLAIFPLTSLFYYGFFSFNLRSIGWLKPFIIGFIWAGLATIYPVIFYCIQHNIPYEINWISILLFIKNFMFVSLLCIMFDVKDYAVDHQQHLTTLVVKAGLRKTIFHVIIPLSCIGLGLFVLYGITHQFHWMKISLNVIPFALLISVAYSLHQRRSILYYLIVIDGLMLVKACLGSTAMYFF